MNVLTNTQRAVLEYMDARNLGAIRFKGEYIFPVNIRNNNELAEQILITISK